MSDYIKNNFLPEDHEQAKEQLDSFMHNTNLASRFCQVGSVERSFIHHENAKRSQKVLSELRDKHDKAWFIIKQNEADMKMAEMLVKAYD